MNQFLLALRSLLVGCLIFLVLASLTAWFFGGALFPKDPVVQYPTIPVGGSHFFLTVKGSKNGPAPVEYALMQRGPQKDDAAPQPVVPQTPTGQPAISGVWRQVLGPRLTADGALRLAVGADRGGSALEWWMVEIKPGEKATAQQMSSLEMPIEALLGVRGGIERTPGDKEPPSSP